MRGFTSDSLRIYLMTVGQGDEIYELFGHNGLWVHDPTQPVDTVYNWGVFDFATPGFIRRFLLGHNEYIMAGYTLDETVRYYRAQNRVMVMQELNLTGPEKKALVAFLRWNSLPENATYRYDYYRDNCSTRVRDAIDRVTHGQIRAHLRAIKTNETYRWHTLRLMQGMKAIVSGVELLLGPPTDVPLTAYETSFLPVELMKHIRSARLDAGARPLIKEEFTVYTANRPPEPDRAPHLWTWFAPIAAVIVGLVLWMNAGSAAGPRRRRALALSVGFLAGVFGVLGLIITGLITITDHVAAHGNENIFMLNPLWLVIAVLAARVILHARLGARTVWLVRIAAATSCFAVLIHLMGLSRQPNWDAIVLVLPIELTIAWILTASPPPGRTSLDARLGG